MQYHRIPHSSLEVSTLGLGTMTFGEQNSEADAHAQLDYAVAQGINLIDVAEMYPVPPRPETQGLTETYVGNWLAKHGSREKLIIASKVSGPSRNNDKGIRPDQALDRKNIREALHDSLKRLQTDYLDLYQVHWPCLLYTSRATERPFIDRWRYPSPMRIATHMGSPAISPHKRRSIPCISASRAIIARARNIAG